MAGNISRTGGRIRPLERWNARTVEDRISVCLADCRNWLIDGCGDLTYKVFDQERNIGFALLNANYSRIHWFEFYPFGDPKFVFHDEYQGHGIASYVHAQIVDDLGRRLEKPASLLVTHATMSQGRRAHLIAMGLPIAQRDKYFSFDFPLYQERSLAYAKQLGFDLSRWKPINDCR